MKYFCLLLITVFSLFGISGVYADNIRTDLSENLLRLHVIANSDSKEDQEIKLAVRDEILKNASGVPDKAKIDAVVNGVLTDMGTDYKGSTSVVRTFVPEKEYKSIRLPEGVYNCINVVLGDGKGENWWCVAYPPLCFTEEVFGELSEDGKLLLENKLSKESFRAIIYDGDVNIRFKLVDEFLKLKNRLW
ncbi:MAG: stage II sporulation protein R [Clostridia bacterium]|nr:stage II sporulation protein R [Clostridia bacterium]